jgi:succinyl-CoA synthetase beta subunit
LLSEKGLPVMPGLVADTPEEVLAAALKIGLPVVLKSQVHVGGRGKAGGIRVVEKQEDIIPQAGAIFNLTIKGLPVRKILVEKKVEVKSEYYLGIIFNRDQRSITLILSGEGGVDIEETAKNKPEAIKKINTDATGRIFDFQIRGALSSIGIPRALHNRFIGICLSLFDAYIKTDCTLLEVNPLGLNDAGELILVDAKMIVDDNGIYRNKKLQAFEESDPENPDEVEARNNGLSYVKMEGNVGCIVNGAGLAMATMDMIKHFGGEPANFLDIGGSSNEAKVTHAMKLILKDPNVRSILVNIFGGITRCDDVAAGLINASKSLKIDRPLTIRLSGTNEDQAHEMLEKEHMAFTTSMEDAVKKAVEALR